MSFFSFICTRLDCALLSSGAGADDDDNEDDSGSLGAAQHTHTHTLTELSLVWKTKPYTTKPHIHQSTEMYLVGCEDRGPPG